MKQTLFILAASLLAHVTTLPAADLQRAIPQSVNELWADFAELDKHTPLEIEVLKEWELDGVICRIVRYQVGVFKGAPSRVAAFYAFPKGGTKLPALVEMHGGGQSASLNSVVTYAKRGYASISINWGGNKMSLGQETWSGPQSDWGKLDATHPPQRNKANHFAGALTPDEYTLDAVESPRNSNWYLVLMASRRAITFLEQQPEVDATRIGAHGHSMGGKLTTNFAGILGCGFMKPRDPFIAPKKYFDLYPLESLKIWHDPADMTPARKDAVGFGAYGEAFAKFTDQEWRELFRAYCAGTSFMDAQLGRVLDALDKRKLWDKTLVIFVGDHGYHTGERNWWNKNTLFERSCRAPLIIAAPGMKGGQVSRSLVEFVDLYPTVADVCGLKIPHEVAGVSLHPVLGSPDAKVKEAAFTLVTRGPKLYGQSIRTARWRFTRWSDGQTELYDHDRDTEELRNVSGDNPDIMKTLSEQLRKIGTPQP